MKKKILSTCIIMALAINAHSEDFNVQVNPLHYAASINETEYVENLISGDPELASQLNKDGLTPIHLAIKKNSVQSLKAIFKEKINPNIKNSEGETPLVYAIKLKKPKAISFLLSIGANKKIKDNMGSDSIDYAQKSSPEIKELFFPKMREIIYQEGTENIKTSDKAELNELISIKTDDMLASQKMLKKTIDGRLNEIEDKRRIQMSLLLGSIKKIQNEMEILKLENEELKSTVKTISFENNESYKKIWELELDIKQLREDNKEFKRKQIMGIYSSEKDTPEVNPIISINKKANIIENNEETLNIIPTNLEAVIIKEVEQEETVILDFK